MTDPTTWLVLYERGDVVWAFSIEAPTLWQAIDLAEQRPDTPPSWACVGSINPDQLEYFEQQLCKPIILK